VEEKESLSQKPDSKKAKTVRELKYSNKKISKMWTILAILTTIVCVRKKMQDNNNNNSKKKSPTNDTERKVVKIVLTGGPCGGKSTALSKVTSALTNSGIRVLTVPEAATILFSNGFKSSDPLQIQIAIMKMQISLEDQFEKIASGFEGQRSVLLCDRGLMDGKAYMDTKLWYKLLKIENLKETDARDTRYDSVIHLVTAADGAADFYTLENNTARHESKEQAIEQDRRTQNAWIGHSRLRVIGNDDGKGNKVSFNKKIGNVIDSVKALLGLQPLAPEREKRFVIGVTRDVPEEYDFTTQDIYKLYLKGKENIAFSYVQAKRNDEITMYSQVIFHNQNGMTFEKRSILNYNEYKTWATSSTDVVGMLCSKRTCSTFCVMPVRYYDDHHQIHTHRYMFHDR